MKVVEFNNAHQEAAITPQAQLRAWEYRARAAAGMGASGTGSNSSGTNRHDGHNASTSSSATATAGATVSPSPPVDVGAPSTGTGGTGDGVASSVHGNLQLPNGGGLGQHGQNGQASTTSERDVKVYNHGGLPRAMACTQRPLKAMACHDATH